ncbi:MAG TPA: MBL fold metallo-hydrolase, partial [Micropepsaceae bacterium]|nr:MBL fold metallo-hydrolase [Micropepsaceae bacterium]
TVATAFLITSASAQAQYRGFPKSPTSPISQHYREEGKDNVALQKVPPIHMFDNVWYVGPGYVSCYLIKTSAGSILIDASEEPDMVMHVIDSIKKTGTDLKDIKAILISNGHIDHWGGIDRMRELTGAPVYATEEDWKLIERAAAQPGRNGAPPPRAPKRDRVIHDGDKLTIGDTTLDLMVTPGHTPGVMSAIFTVYDNGKPYKAFYSGGLGGRDGVKGFEQAMISSARVAKIEGIQVYFANHGWNPGTDYPGGSIFERAEKLKTRKGGDPNPFVDPAAWQQNIKQTQERVAKGLEEEKAKAASAAK